MKNIDVVKNALRTCVNVGDPCGAGNCEGCPYLCDGNCQRDIARDALAALEVIENLEEQIASLLRELRGKDGRNGKEGKGE